MHRGEFFATLIAGILTFCLLLCSSAFLPVVWDEGYMAERSDGFLSWLAEGTYHDINAFCPSVEGHPCWPIMLASGKAMLPESLSPQTRLRFGAIAFFSLALAVVFYRLHYDFGRAAAVFGCLAIFLIPRVFTHAQVATWDSPLMASWLLCWAFFPLALHSGVGAVLLGGAVGLACSSKFSGLPAVLPIFAWLTLRWLGGEKFLAEKRMLLLKRAALTTVIAFGVFYALNPQCWGNVFEGIAAFFRLNLNRSLNISVLYFGQMYDLDHPLPWTNTLVWTAVTVPGGMLILFFVGLGTIVYDKEKRWPGLFLFLNFLTLLVIRALPGTPVHDGVRLFAPAFPFLALIAGLGAARLWTLLNRARRVVTRLLVLGIYASCAFNMFWYAPQWLSYYNIIIGGLPGAVRAGMEPTYFWDGLDQELIDWLNAHTEPGETVAFSAGSRRAFELRRHGETHNFEYRSFREAQEETLPVRYYVLQRRPSAEHAYDQWLTEHATPVFVKTIRRGGLGPWNLGSVPIIAVYDVSDL